MCGQQAVHGAPAVEVTFAGRLTQPRPRTAHKKLPWMEEPGAAPMLTLRRPNGSCSGNFCKQQNARFPPPLFAFPQKEPRASGIFERRVK